MAKQQLRDHINLIKRKLTTLDNINEDIINEISQDVNALLKFKIDITKTKISNNKKQINKTKPKLEHTQYYKISDEPETEHEPKSKNNDNEFTISTGGFILDFGMG